MGVSMLADWWMEDGGQGGMGLMSRHEGGCGWILARISGGKGVVHKMVSGVVGVSTLISLVGITVVVAVLVTVKLHG